VSVARGGGSIGARGVVVAGVVVEVGFCLRGRGGLVGSRGEMVYLVVMRVYVSWL